jgi:nucleotide-binding universal stress UspA family protein
MIGTVAVGTDGSETAAIAVDWALEFAQRCGAKLVVLSAYAPATDLGAQWAATSAIATERMLDDVESAARERGLEVRTAMEEGDPAEVLVGLAERHGADLLVIGNRGMERRILGSVPNSVTHAATCSVLVVKTT